MNMAVHLVHDGHRGRYEVAVLITNDSDLVEAVRIVREDLRLPVGILCPHRRPSISFKAQASFVKPIRAGALAKSQFPPTRRDSRGPFRKPAGW